MGMLNPRAICPNCGGKIHTQGVGPIGAFGQATGNVCQHCGVALSGKVNPLTNTAQLATPPPPPTVAQSNPDVAHCEACGGHVPVHAGFFGKACDKQCPECGVALNGRVGGELNLAYVHPSARGARKKWGPADFAQQSPAAPPSDQSSSPAQTPHASVEEAPNELIDGLERLARLHESGSLTDEEYAEAKATLLHGGR